MLPSSDLKNSALRTIVFSVLISPAHRHRYRRFADALTDAAARLAETCDWFHLHVRRLSLPTFRPVSLALQIRTCALTHPAPRSGYDGTPLELPCRSVPVQHLTHLGASRLCVRSLAFPSRLPLRPALRSANSATWHSTLCSLVSSLLWPSPTPPRRSSSDRLLPSLRRPRRNAPW